MKTVKSSYMNKIIIKNSQFICILMPITSNDINSILDNVKVEYPKASHYCYAYIYDDVMHSSDDGEPGGTAGMPILNVLLNEKISNILCIVVRYFGGIKLGAGGLVRAYTKAVTDTIKIASFVELISGYKISIQFNYDDEKQVLYILGNSKIIEREYLESIKYICLVDDDILSKLESYTVSVLEQLYIEKLN